MKATTAILVMMASALAFTSCNTEEYKSPSQIEKEQIIATQNTLMGNTWGFKNFTVEVIYESRALPFMVRVADENGMVQPGIYDAYDIFGTAYNQEFTSFLYDRDMITMDTTGNGNYEDFAGYFLINTTEMRLNPINTDAVRTQYAYAQNNGIFGMMTNGVRNKDLVNAINKMITSSILTGKPGETADALIDFLLNNEKVKAAVEQQLYDLIYGKVDEISSNPEKVAGIIANKIVEKIQEIDWQSIVYDKVLEILNKLQVENPEVAAQELSERIANKIQTILSEQNIYDVVYPILKDFEQETLPSLAPTLAEAVYNKITEVFTEQNIYDKVYPMWEEFTEMDSLAIVQVADTLGQVVTNHFFDTTAMAAQLEPYLVTIDQTPIFKLPELSQSIIDNILIPAVDTINTRFPGAEIDPNWSLVKTGLTSALTLIKTSIGNTGVEAAAASLAVTIKGLLETGIQAGFRAALFRLQDIPADQAALTLASWLSNLVIIAEPQIVDFLESKFNAIIDKFNAEEVARALAQSVSIKVAEVFSQENIYNILYPVLKAISDLDKELAAQKITDWLFDLGIVKDNIDKDQVIATLTQIISNIIQENVDAAQVTQRLVDAILGSNIVENIEGTLLKKVLAAKIYMFMIDILKEINAIEEMNFSMIRK
jgi:hypothetical protein